MVRIRAERRTSGNGWVWGLLVFVVTGLALLLFFFIYGNGIDAVEEEGLPADTTGVEDTTIGNAPLGEERSRSQDGVITSFATLRTRTHSEELAGRRVAIGSVRVTRVYNDSTFLLTSVEARPPDTASSPSPSAEPPMSEQVLAVLANGAAAQGAMGPERAPLREGELISIRATMKRLRRLNLSQRGVSQSEAQTITPQQVYLQVDQHTPLQ